MTAHSLVLQQEVCKSQLKIITECKAVTDKNKTDEKFSHTSISKRLPYCTSQDHFFFCSKHYVKNTEYTAKDYNLAVRYKGVETS